MADAGRARRRLLPRRTVRLRLTVLYGSLFLASGVGVLGITYALVRHDIGNSFLTTEKNGAITTVFGITRGNLPVGVATLAPGAQIIGGAGHLSTSHTGAQGRSGGVTVEVPVPGVAPGKVPTAHQAQEQLDILRNEATKTQNDELHRLLLDSGIALLVMAVLSVLLGWMVSGRVLRPLRQVTTTARAISSTNLHERIGLDGPDDEVKELGDTFDDLLGRLEQSFEAQRQFVANASHELRTPLARQRTLLEVALADPEADDGTLRAAATQAIAAGEEQERIIEALLTLASSERGLDQRTPFDLADAASRAVRTKGAEAALRVVRTDSYLAPAPTTGNERLAHRLIANLVDNALRYNVEGGWIEIVTRCRDAHAVVRVSNSGPVVPAAELPRLLRPFERLAVGRIAKDGHGLGLSIVAAIATAHGARLSTVARPDGGLDVEVAFPLAPPAVGAAGPGPDPGARRRGRAGSVPSPR